MFFGQKELAASEKNSERDLIEKLLGIKCDEIRGRIAGQKIRVTEAIDRLSKARNVGELIEEQTKIKQDAEFRLNFYKDHNLEEKPQKRLGFGADIRKAERGIDLVETFISDIRELLAKHEDELRNFPGYVSEHNAPFFKKFDALFFKAVQSMETIKAELAKAEIVHGELRKDIEQLIAEKNGLSDEFAAIERTLADELKSGNGQNISSDEFLMLKKKLSRAEAELAILSKSDSQKTNIRDSLREELQKLNDLWHREFQIIKGELDMVSRENAPLKFSVDFKGDKTAFRDYFRNIFRGSGARETTFQNIADRYQDFIGIYSDFENAKKFFGSDPENFAGMFEQNLNSLLTYQTPNKFTITYHDKELAHHSLGQRASALILFVLSRKENDVVIIDQPEDDLDNQTIYEDVIKLIRKLKPETQFIFATHNPNIPVLGDAEQIHACVCSDSKIAVQSGALDNPEQQKKIVDIMEGGKEAFERRKDIYRNWKP